GFPVGQLPGGTHSVRLKVDSTGAISESSETDNEYTRTFSVANPLSLSVATPNNGNPLSACNSYSINWTTSGDTASISSFRFGYSLDGGSTFTELGDTIPSSSRSFSWTPHAIHSTQERVRILAYNSSDQSVSGATNPSNFTITIPSGKPNANPATLNISPTAGSSVQFYGSNSTPSSSCSQIVGHFWN